MRLISWKYLILLRFNPPACQNIITSWHVFELKLIKLDIAVDQEVKRLPIRLRQDSDIIRHSFKIYLHLVAIFVYYCTEALTMFYNICVHGCKIAQAVSRISHLLFVNDCFLYFKAAILDEAREVKEIYGLHGGATG